jgi:peptidoglycan/LPS O-acetylase OafA/YrhL
MDGSKALHAKVDLRTAPAVRRTDGGDADAVTRTGTERLTLWWAAVAGLLGPVIAAVAIALEPPAADPDAGEPLFISLVGYALLWTWVAAAALAWRRRPAALGWAAAAAGLSVVVTVACPTSGHHDHVGAWWYGQLAVCLGGLGAVLGGWRSLRPATRP